MLEDWIKRDINTLRKYHSKMVAEYAAIRLADDFCVCDGIFDYLTEEEQVLLDAELQKHQDCNEFDFSFGSLSRGKWDPETIETLIEGINRERQLEIRDRKIRDD